MQIGHYFFHAGGVKEEDYQNCLNWAFGNLLHEELDASILRTLWNQRHGDIFEVTDDEAQMVEMFLAGVGRAFVEVHYHVPKSERRIIT